MKEFIHQVKTFLDTTAFSLGGSPVTVWRVFYLLAFLILLFSLSRRLGRLVLSRIMARKYLQPGVRESVETLAHYFIIVIGIFVIVSTSGLNFSGLAILAGSLGIGVGFRLQNVVTNLAAGLVILLERPIKMGDHIEIGQIHGRVVSLGARATSIQTNDNVTIIVPNADFINGKVVNWTHGNVLRRFRIPVGVSYRENPEHIREVLLEVAHSHEGVERHPAPDVRFEALGASSLEFELQVWTAVYTERPGVLRSQLYFEIFRRFRAEGIEIPFPQLDVHIHPDRQS